LFFIVGSYDTVIDQCDVLTTQMS